MYYTGRGDDGSSSLFGDVSRISKSDPIFDVLGALDELNSYLGLCHVEAKQALQDKKELVLVLDIINQVQQDLFICQAHIARANINIPADFLIKVEKQIEKISSQIKKRANFVLSGGSKISALLDVSRTLARRAERQLYQLNQEVLLNLNPLLASYLNRLSSLLYVLARLSNDIYDFSEESPNY